MTEKQRESLLKDDIPNSGDTNASAVDKTQNSINKEITREKSLEKEAKKPHPEMSKGEKVFNFTAYNFLNYWVNLVSSIAVADRFLNGKGRETLDVWINKATHVARKIMPLKVAHHNSKTMIETFVFTSGGLFLLAPLKIMEDNKRKIVHWVNKKLGVNQKKADGTEKTHDEIYIEQEQPKQSWGNVIWRRIQATAVVIGVGSALDYFVRDKNNILPPEKYNIGNNEIITYEAKAKGGKKVVSDYSFNKINKLSETMRGKPLKPKGIVGRWTELAILDSVFTVITAVIMKVTNGAKKAKMPKEIDETNHPPADKELLSDSYINEAVTGSTKNKFTNRVERKDSITSIAKKNIRDEFTPQENFADKLKYEEPALSPVGI
ncbi:MAG: hypothetical protein R3D71_04690 [Rickettsiales bacterium]